MARGTSTYMRKDGLLVMRPRRGLGLLRILKASAMVVAGGICFKAQQAQPAAWPHDQQAIFAHIGRGTARHLAMCALEASNPTR
ncbi:MAG: hypothetical protein AAGH17_10065, partial [Pseudomonadota bacterium]